jgi:hypothetical protein
MESIIVVSESASVLIYQSSPCYQPEIAAPRKIRLFPGLSFALLWSDFVGQSQVPSDLAQCNSNKGGFGENTFSQTRSLL